MLLKYMIEWYLMLNIKIKWKRKNIWIYFSYNIYIAKVALYLGITKTRPVFESAIENL